MQVENQEAMKGIITSVNQQKHQAMTMQLPQMHPPHFVSPHKAGTIPLPTIIPVTHLLSICKLSLTVAAN